MLGHHTRRPPKLPSPRSPSAVQLPTALPTPSAGAGNMSCSPPLPEVAPSTWSPSFGTQPGLRDRKGHSRRGGRGPETLCPLPDSTGTLSTQHCPAHHQLTPHTGCRAGWITYLKFTVFLSLFGSLLITGPLRTRKSKHFRWNGERWAGTHSATIRTVRVYKTSQIFKRGFLAQSKCTTRVPHSDQHLRKHLAALREKGGAVGAHSRHLTTTLVPFYNFIIGGKSAERAFLWALGWLTSLARWVFRGSASPGRHFPTRPGAQGPWPPRSALGGRGCPVQAGGLLVGQPLAQRGVPPPKRGPSQFNTGPKLTSSVNVLREASTPLSSMKLQVSGNQEFISDTLGLWPSTSHCLPTSSTHGRSELLKATPTPSALQTFTRCLIGRQGKASEKLTRPVKLYTQILPLEKRYLFNLLN